MIDKNLYLLLTITIPTLMHIEQRVQQEIYLFNFFFTSCI